MLEPGIELPNAPEVAPDVAGWRRERMPALPSDAGSIGTHTDETEARLEPFDTVPLNVADWWPPASSDDD